MQFTPFFGRVRVSGADGLTSLAAPLPAQALPAALSGPPLAHTHTGGRIEPKLEAHRAPRPLFGSNLPLFLVLVEPLVQTAPFD